MTDENNTPPPTWGKDSLTRYLDTCKGNQWATFVNKRSEITDLSAINTMFDKLLEGAIDPKPLLPMGFFMRSHSAYLSSCASVMAGQLNDAWALLRVCLEYGGYAYYVGTDIKRWERWMSRHDARSRSQEDKWRKEFSHGNVIRAIKAADNSLATNYQYLYNQAIDFGAHPNERGMSFGTELEDINDGGRHFRTLYLHRDGFPLDFALRTTAQVGICILKIAQIIYPLRSELSGVRFQLETLAKRF